MPFRSEAEFVRWLDRRWPSRGRGFDLGIGDDAALIRASATRDFVLTTDFSIEDVHFRFDLHPPRSIGHRALARALSDLAAMGATPRFALLSLALRRGLTRSWITSFYDGLAALAGRFGVTLIGGDTAVIDAATTVDIIAIGEVERGRALLRSGARPGDRVYLTGRLGLSELGLALLRRGARPAASASRSPKKIGRRDTAIKEALERHLYPEPRCTAGITLVRRRLVSAAIDVSDGFAADLSRLCESSGCGAAIREADLPFPPAGLGRDPLELGLHGGEDYELIFTVPAARAARVPRKIGKVNVHDVGEIQAGRRLTLRRTDGREIPLDTRGYDHFRKLRAARRT
ncbi:MAG TPA: thiamine-phosphate kinase [Terriglobia bacterium]|nr:thiamine-phosphate kinase [Terriglobia bacterium]